MSTSTKIPSLSLSHKDLDYLFAKEDLLARLANLSKVYDLEIQDQKVKDLPFPLAALLDIHYKSSRQEPYWAERIQGFKLLCNWLAPLTYTSTNRPHIDYIVIRTPHELSEMEYYAGINNSHISGKDIVECSLNLLTK